MNGRSKRCRTGILLLVLTLVTPRLNATDDASVPIARRPEWPFAIGAAQRPGAYWWCPGIAFTREDIDWNLEQFRAGGFGFVHIIPIYGARGAESQYIPYLSPRWMQMLDYTVRKAQALGLFVDMTNLSANRIRDLELRKVPWKIMRDANIVSVSYQRFDPAKWPLEESGLLGPVRLLPEKRFVPTP